jgi:hypothetical protein
MLAVHAVVEQRIPSNRKVIDGIARLYNEPEDEIQTKMCGNGHFNGALASGDTFVGGIAAGAGTTSPSQGRLGRSFSRSGEI